MCPLRLGPPGPRAEEGGEGVQACRHDVRSTTPGSRVSSLPMRESHCGRGREAGIPFFLAADHLDELASPREERGLLPVVPSVNGESVA